MISKQKWSWTSSQWNNQFVGNASLVFSGPKNELHEIEKLRAERDELHKRIGEKEMDLEFLKKTARNWA